MSTMSSQSILSHDKAFTSVFIAHSNSLFGEILNVIIYLFVGNGCGILQEVLFTHFSNGVSPKRYLVSFMILNLVSYVLKIFNKNIPYELC